jgi:hypothetical protein
MTGRELDAEVAENRHARYYRENRERILARHRAQKHRDRAKIQERERAYLSTKAGKESNYRKTRAWAKRNPEKRRAHEAVKAAIRSGVLTRRPCKCGNKRSHAHHDDYSKPLVVLWLCAPCHVLRHKQLRKLA